LRRFLPTRLTTVSNRLARRAAELYGKRFKLSAPEWRIIAVLGHQGGMSSSTVIAETAMDKVRVSRAIAKLLKAGLITRDTDPSDRRRAVLALKGPGGELFQQIIPLIQDAEAEMMAALSDAERDAFSDVLAKIEVYLERTASGVGIESEP
jgi:DNA-binding MarR family transcriptional regulator